MRLGTAGQEKIYRVRSHIFNSENLENNGLKKSSRFGDFCSVFVWVIQYTLPIVVRWVDDAFAHMKFRFICAGGRYSNGDDK